MLFQRIILGLGIVFYSLSSHFLHGDNKSRSGDGFTWRPTPLMTSNYIPQSPASDLTHSFVTSIKQLTKILGWDQVIILSHNLHCEDTDLLISDSRLNSQHCLDDINNGIEIKQLLQQLHAQFFPKLHFLLLSNYSMALRLLQMVEQMDLESNRTTDFRHYSFWMIACVDFLIPQQAFFHTYIKWRMLLWSLLKTKTVFSPLLTVSRGRRFSQWKCVEEIKVEDDVFPNKKYGLNNRSLIVSLLVLEPYVIKNKNGFEGHYIDILNCIASKMNFSYETVYPEDMQWGSLVDGRWNGLVGHLERREVDLVVAALTVHEDREKVMDFLYPLMRSKVDDIMYRIHSEYNGNWKIYLKLFRPLVLIVLLVILVMYTLAVGIVFPLECQILKENLISNNRRQINKLTDASFYMIAILLNRGVQYNPRRQSTRVLLFTWGVFSVIIAACYSANLVASFTVQTPDLPFTSLGELVRQNKYKWGFLSGAIREHIFNLSRTGDMRLAWEGVQELYKTDPEVLSNNYSVHISKVMTEKYAFIVTRDAIQRLRSEDCSIRYVGQNIIWHHNGIGVPTDYPLSKDIETILSRITESGLPDIWWRRWGAAREDQCAPDDTVMPLTFTDTVSAFYLLSVGVGTACLALVLEIIKYRRSF